MVFAFMLRYEGQLILFYGDNKVDTSTVSTRIVECVLNLHYLLYFRMPLKRFTLNTRFSNKSCESDQFCGQSTYTGSPRVLHIKTIKHQLNKYYASKEITRQRMRLFVI